MATLNKLTALRSRKVWIRTTGMLILSLILVVALQINVVFAAAAFTENFAGASSSYFSFLQQGGSTITSGFSDSGASDGKAVQLALPANAAAGPGSAPNLQSTTLYSFGTFEARMKTANCSTQPNTGIVNGFFTYLNDGTDQNGNGVADNSEIDFEILCAEPNVIWLTQWTDYQDSPLAMKRIYRELDLASGQIRRTCYSEGYGVCTQDLTGSGTEGSPSSITPISGFNSSTAYYTYGFTWASNRLTWYIYNSSGQKIILWDYQGPSARITQRSAYYFFNVWHTSSWAPTTNGAALESNNTPRYLNVDWATYGVGAPPPTSTQCVGCPTATRTLSPTPAPSCYAAWISNITYPTGARVTYNGVNYQANYPTNGDNPALHSGPAGSGQPWLTLGNCTGNNPTATNTPVGPTATRTNTPVGPTPTRTNTPIGPTPTRTNTPGTSVNLALGKIATGSTLTNPGLITNGDKNTNNFAGQDLGLRSIVIDLGQNYNLSKVNIWHYFGDGRTYHDVIVQVSTVSDFSTKTTVFNNDTNNSAGQGTGTNAEYAETSAGKTITFTPVLARYVRLWINGSSANVYNHYVEVEIYQ